MELKGRVCVVTGGASGIGAATCRAFAAAGAKVIVSDTSSAWAVSAAGPIKEATEVADMVVQGFRNEDFLILTDPIAQTWMERKTGNIDRWLNGMRRLQANIETIETGEESS